MGREQRSLWLAPRGWAVLYIPCNQLMRNQSRNKSSPNLPLLLLISPPSTSVDQVTALAPLPASGYELRSQGPPILGTNALDTFWSPAPGVMDKHVWNLSSSGQYTAKSAYDAQFHGAVSFGPWERIWKSRAPAKCRFLLWPVAHNRVVPRKSEVLYETKKLGLLA